MMTVRFDINELQRLCVDDERIKAFFFDKKELMLLLSDVRRLHDSRQRCGVQEWEQWIIHALKVLRVVSHMGMGIFFNNSDIRGCFITFLREPMIQKIAAEVICNLTYCKSSYSDPPQFLLHENVVQAFTQAAHDDAQVRTHLVYTLDNAKEYIAMNATCIDDALPILTNALTDVDDISVRVSAAEALIKLAEAAHTQAILEHITSEQVLMMRNKMMAEKAECPSKFLNGKPILCPLVPSLSKLYGTLMTPRRRLPVWNKTKERRSAPGLATKAAKVPPWISRNKVETTIVKRTRAARNKKASSCDSDLDDSDWSADDRSDVEEAVASPDSDSESAASYWSVDSRLCDDDDRADDPAAETPLSTVPEQSGNAHIVYLEDVPKNVPLAFYVGQIVPGMDVEVQMKDEGLVGARYLAQVLQQSHDKQQLLVRYKSLIDDDSNALEEWVPTTTVRACTESQCSYEWYTSLKCNDRAELWYEDAWWDVTVRARRNSSPVQFTVAVTGYGIEHTVVESSKLRPASIVSVIIPGSPCAVG